MKKSEIHYRYTDDGVVVSKPNKWKLEFPGAKYARHKDQDIIVYNSYNMPIRIDKNGSKHYHW